MHFPSLTVTLLATAASASAGPSSRISARSCLEQPPSSIGYPINFDITPSRPNSISFQIPPNSVGPCTLVAKFPPGYPIESSGSDLVSVTALDGPAPGALVGSLRFRSAPDAQTVTYVNSFQCADVMAYELSIADGLEGEVRFQQIQGAGLFMQVGDC